MKTISNRKGDQGMKTHFVRKPAVP
jgi:hypothetical protein